MPPLILTILHLHSNKILSLFVLGAVALLLFTPAILGVYSFPFFKLTHCLLGFACLVYLLHSWIFSCGDTKNPFSGNNLKWYNVKNKQTNKNSLNIIIGEGWVKTHRGTGQTVHIFLICNFMDKPNPPKIQLSLMGKKMT